MANQCGKPMRSRASCTSAAVDRGLFMTGCLLVVGGWAAGIIPPSYGFIIRANYPARKPYRPSKTAAREAAGGGACPRFRLGRWEHHSWAYPMPGSVGGSGPGEVPPELAAR